MMTQPSATEPDSTITGVIKTFSAALGRGSAEVRVDGTLRSVPFNSAVIEGSITQLRSGDKVKVTMDNERSEIVKLELDEASTSDSDDQPSQAPKKRASPRFTKKNLARRGSRLDYG
jgi:hypothetical protein